MTNPIIDQYGDIKYLNDKGQPHRLDGPAIEWSGGTKLWFVDGKHHRIDGSASEFSNGVNLWYIDNQKLDVDDVEDWYKDNGLDLNIPLTTDNQILFKLKFG